MNSGWDTPKGWVSPFGHPRINDRSHLPAAFRSVPRPSSPLGAKASTECPSLTPYPHHRPRTGPNHAPCCLVSSGSARIIPSLRSSLGQAMCVTYSHTRSSSPCERTCRSAGFPVPSRGSRTASAERNRSWKCRRALAQRTRLQPSPPRHCRRTQISPSANGAKGNGDGRIRTDDPLLAKQVLSH
jgi:hypothetical protein